MPVPEPKQDEDEQTFVSRCIKEMHHIDPDQKDKQIQAICYTQWREKRMMNQSEPIPILRSFESEGKRYVYGYAAIFDSEDSYGTTMTREAVESSLPHLQKFPAVRFMHRIPFGQIVFGKEVDGASTFIDDYGFHVLCHIYDERTDEWNMVNAGKWGFSYGFQPATEGGMEMRKLANGHMVPAFVKGTFFEVSVVDTPSQLDAVAYVINRMIHGDTGEIITAELSSEQRDKLPDSAFAAVYEENGKKVRKLPIHDKEHAIAALQALHGARGGADLPASVRAEAERKVKAALARFGVKSEGRSLEIENKGNKEEFEQWLKDAETRIIASITKNLEAKQSKTSFEDSIKAMEARMTSFVEKKLADQVPEKSRVEQTFESVNTKLASMDTKIANLKGIEKSLKSSGEDYKALTERIVAYEKQRDALVNSITESVQKTVERSLGSVEDRLSAIENIPDLRSPATLSEKVGVHRGMGFGAMLEGARSGTE